MTVISTAGSAEKLEMCKKLGADYTINYKTENFEEKVNEFTKGRGVDIIADPIGAQYFEMNTKSIALDGRWIFYGTMGGGEVDKVNLRPLLHKRVNFIATTLKSRSDLYKKELLNEMVNTVFPAIRDKEFNVIISKTFQMSEVRKAH